MRVHCNPSHGPLLPAAFCALFFRADISQEADVLYIEPHERETKSSQGDTDPLEEIRDWKGTK